MNLISNFKLIRERDGLVKEGNKIVWIKWNDSGSFDQINESISTDCSLYIENDLGEWWLTTPILHIETNTTLYKRFITKNSTYDLYYSVKDS